VRNLHRSHFLADPNNVVMVGDTGIGKTYLAIAIARQSIKSRKK
jgi:DNA replication protein DnaC